MKITEIFINFATFGTYLKVKGNYTSRVIS